MTDRQSLNDLRSKLTPAQRALVESRLRGETAAAGVQAEITPRTDREQAALSYAQQRLWFLDQFHPGNPLYNIARAFSLKGSGLKIDALNKSINELVRRHEVLRTSFRLIGNEPVQVIAPEMKLDLLLTDLSHLSAAERETEASRIAADEAERPFDLEAGPLLRVSLLRLSETEHVLVLVIHHIITDGWSTGVLLREFRLLYAAFSERKHSPLEDLTIQYADFAQWQREWLTGEVLDRQLSYWRKRLAGAPAVLELSTDHPRPAVQTHRGARKSRVLPASLAESLHQLSRQEDVTLFMTLLAAFQTLLYRYSHQEDFCIGTSIANRNRAELEPLIGFFVNTLVMRADLAGNPSFKELLKRVKEVSVDAYAHQDLPFEKLVEALEPERALSHTPLFQVMMMLQNTARETWKLAGLNVNPFKVARDMAKFDLVLTIVEGQSGLSVILEYNTDLFESATIERMLGHFEVLLSAVAEDPEQRVAEVALLTGAEIEQVREWNQTATAYPPDICVHEFFAARAASSPHAIAVSCGAEQLTYRELNEKANQLGRYLQTLGVTTETRVGICVERSIAMVVGLLGILKAGGVYVPLDPEYPAQRLAFMAADAAVSVLLTQERLLAQLPACEQPIVCIDRDWDLIAEQSVAEVSSAARAANLANIIYTSGSTGAPKGVAISHQAINRLVFNACYVSLSSADVVAQTANASFDAITFELWGGLLSGARVHIISQEQLLEPARLAAVLRAEQVTVLFLTTALFNQMGRQQPAGFAGVQQLLFGGQQVAPQWVRAVLESGYAGRLMHMYGPAEATTFATWHEVGEVEAGAVTVPIGKAIANTQAYILDRELAPVPVGVIGELYVGGAGLARGYWQRASLTAERFIPNPYSEVGGERLYRTGDLVRYRADGAIEFIGRLDEQVKVRGYRIELGEIESVLQGHPGVADCVMNVRVTGEEREQRLVAYLVSSAEAKPAVSELRRYLEEKLPEFMIPSQYVWLAELPLTPGGKVDRKALPEPEHSGEARADEFVAPRTAEEEILAGIFEQVLRVSQVGVHDNFFKLGGHSLLATQVVSRIRQSLKVELPIADLFQVGTVAGLAQKIKAIGDAETGGAQLEISMVSREEALPLSYAQQRLWFLDQLAPELSVYNVPLALRLQGKCDLAVLERSLSEIVRRHEALRTSFRMNGGGESAQVIAAAEPVRIPFTDLSSLPESERAAQVQQLIREQAAQPFVLATGPLLRACLLGVGEEEQVLVVVMHHIITDGWSLEIIFRELKTLYQAYSDGKSSPLPELTIQYGDFAHWQREWLTGAVLEKQLSYWVNQLAGAAPVLELPTDHGRPALQSHRGARATRMLPRRLAESLRDLSRNEGVTLFMTLLAGFQTLLYRYSRQDDFCVGADIANRNRAEVEPLIGFFVNMLVLRADLKGNPTFRELLQRVKDVCLGAYAHQDVPFEKLVEELAPERALSHTPLFQVVMLFQNMPREAWELAGLKVNSYRIERETSKFDIVLTMRDGEAGLAAVMEYNTDLFECATIERMLGHLEMLLEEAAGDPELRVADVRLLTTAEQVELSEWQRKDAEYPTEKCLHELFAEQVQADPHAVAVVYEDQQLTYQELNERANQLGRHLQALGIKPEARVGLCVERSLEMVVGLLGILKAGAAYVPLDPEYPEQRLAFMLADAEVSVVLTQERLLTRLPETEAPLICLDSDWPEIAEQSNANITSEVSVGNLAYVIYTSGSTGQPKGSMVTHENVLRLFSATEEQFHFSSRDVWTLFHSYAFDFSVWELWGALLYGGRLVVVPYWISRQPDAFYELLSREQVTVLNQTPSAFRQLLKAEGEGAARKELAVRLVIFGGEALELGSLRPWYEQPGRAATTQLVNMYGITETTVHVTQRELQPADLEQPLQGSPIGRSLGDLEAYVLESNLQPLPVGVPGELYIGGAGLARGYLKRPELTAERFIPHPYSSAPGARLYRTGDLARYRAGGELEYLGRSDQQVKVRGYRIELGEIEAVLTQHPALAEAVVAPREYGPGDTRLVAYLVPDEQQAFVIQSLLRIEKEAGDTELFELPNGMTVAHLNKSETQFLYNEIFEGQAYLKHGIRLGAGACVFDVGANIGLFTLFIGRMCEDATVYAFEPLPPVYQVLADNARIYGLNVKTFECGLASEARKESFTYYPHCTILSGRFADEQEESAAIKAYLLNEEARGTGESGTESVTESGTESGTESVGLNAELMSEMVSDRLSSEQYECELKTISQVIAEHEITQIDLLKIDVEKSELEVIGGISAADWKKIKQVIVEVHDHDGRLEQVKSLLQQQGYDLTVEQDSILKDTALYNIYAVRQGWELTAAPARSEEKRWESPRQLIGEVHEYLQAQLPAYMVPAHFVLLEQVPLTANGKLDRQALPAPEQSRAQADETLAPRTPAEEILSGIFQQVLKIKHVGIHDNFFLLGGHSLLATQVVSRIRQSFNLELPLHTFFESPTIAALAQTIRSAALDATAGSVITPVNREMPVPLSFAQQRLWFLDQLVPELSVYNVPMAWRLRGTCEREVLERSLNEIVRRHEALRTCFGMIDGKPVQVIGEVEAVDLPLIDLSRLTEEEKEIEARQFVTEEAERPFDLEVGPLLRASLLRLNAEEHVLVLVLHHIITDGWSLGIMFRELMALYKAYSEGSESPLEELTVQYADFAHWQREWLSGDVLEGQLSYWRKQLAGVPPVMELPTGQARPAVQGHQGALQRRLMSPELAASLKELSQQEGVTLFMTLLAGFQAVLYRYSHQEDFCVGADIANRNRAEVEPLIGFFVNLLVLRADVSGNPTFRELLGRVREVCLGAYAHQDLPFEKLVEELAPERALSHTPLFQVLLVLQNTPREVWDLPGMTVSPFKVERKTAKFDMVLTVMESSAGLAAVIEYNTELFASEAMGRLLGHWEKLLVEVAADAEQRVGEVKLLTAGEQEQLQQWQGNGSEPSQSERCVHELFAEQVELNPSAIAVSCEGGELSYGELNERANQVAHYLRRLGVTTETRVGICVERSLEMVVGLLGILKAGGVYVPLDAEYPLERVAFMMADAELGVVLTEAKLEERLPSYWGQVVCLDRDWEEIARESVGEVDSIVSVDNLAYIMYTSGSTGQPKGVAIAHRGINRLVFGLPQVKLTEAVVLQGAPLAFDASTFELWGALLHGSRSVLLRERVATAAVLRQVIEREGVTTMWLTSALFNAVVEEDAQALCGVQQLLVGGEALSVAHVRRGQEQLPGTRLLNGYGPTEATTFACCHEIEEVGERELRIPIGRAIGNTEGYILDSRLAVVPVGVSGELYIGGAGLARGYWRQAELTAERFIPHPYSAVGGERLYRTGDVVRYRADGTMEFLGRVDEQVKVRGYRIELGEIESVLNSHPAVAECVVVVRTDDDSHKQLVAYIVGEPALVAEPGAAVATADLRSYLREKLPEYMVPATFVMLETMPLTANGKVERRGLPAPEQQRRDEESGYVEARSEEEEILAGIWCQVLKVERVGIHDNFFELGGDSIRSIQVVSRAQQRGLLNLTVQLLFQHPTIAELSGELKTGEAGLLAQRGVERFSLIGVGERQRLSSEVEDAYPLSRLQAGMVYHTELSPGSGVYHDIISLQLRGQLDEAALRATLAALMARHEVLRTKFDLTSYGEPLQLVQREVAVPLTVGDLSELGAEREQAAVAELVAAERGRDFEWNAATLWRVGAYRRSADSFQLVLSFHHAILDGWSLMTLLSELFEEYRGKQGAGAGEPGAGAGAGEEARALRVSYRDYIGLEQAALESEASRKYWRSKLDQSSRTRLPRWEKKDSTQGGSGQQLLEVVLEGERLAGLRRLAREANVPLKSVLLGGHLRVLSLLSGQAEVVSGFVTNGRPEVADGERVLGLFLNTVPLVARVSGGSWRALVEASWEAERELLEHRRYPLPALQAEFGRGEELFEAVFNYVHYHVYERVQQKKQVELLGMDMVAETNLRLVAHYGMNVDGTQVRMLCVFDDGEIGAEQGERIRGYYERVYEEMSGESGGRYEQAKLLSTAELEELAEWNRTESEYPATKCVHELFAEQVERNPEAIAVSCGAEKLSYRELNERANQLGHYLRSLGVTTETRIGICLERSLEMVVGLLGILKAGGVYVPLDPEYPAPRLAFMVTDAELGVVLTQAKLLAQLPEYEQPIRPTVVCLDRDWEEIAKESVAAVSSTVSVDNLAYIMYTSGSTGQPKGVAIAHRGINRLVFGLPQVKLTEAVVLQGAPLAFDASTFELWGALLHGSRSVLLRERVATAAVLREVIEREGVTTMWLTSALFNAVVEEDAQALRGVRQLLVGGEALSVAHVRRGKESLLGTRLINGYGPTEATTFACCHEIEEVSERELRIPIGRAIGNTEGYILDSRLAPVPVGVSGELYIGGAGLARGYWRQAELTAERFIPHPYSAVGGERLYRTGDVVRYRADGTIEFLGRVDEQVKVRGYRIEPGEIESVLSQHRAIRNCVVVAVADEAAPATDKQLVAYLTFEPESRPSLAELRGYLQQRLPAYMVPAAFIFLDSLPLTTNGKVDREALPGFDHNLLELEQPFTPPETALECVLAGIWAEVLKSEKVGLHDNFAELGGHSLLATRVISRLREELALELPLRTLFEAPTVSGLAEAILQDSTQRLRIEKTAELLHSLSQLSEDEVEKMLAEKNLYQRDELVNESHSRV